MIAQRPVFKELCDGRFPSGVSPMVKLPSARSRAFSTSATARETVRHARSSHGKATNDPACGRGWVMIATAGRLIGHFYIHNSYDSGFV
jgi:hypothetical protein